MSDRIRIAIIGVGTIGLPIAYYFGLKYPVIAYDNNIERIQELKDNFDRNNLFTEEALKNSNILFTTQEEDLKRVNFYIVAVPTRFREGKPDFSHLMSANETIGHCLKKGDVVVYESTFYPGVTEEECVPFLEKISGLKSPQDFAVGYSPERINPGDKEHTFTAIKKIISAQDQNTLKLLQKIYQSVVTAGVVTVSNIKIAEATKLIENTQRDVQIGFINEITLMLDKLGISAEEVFQAMSTKWNYIDIQPGLVGGTCIGKDSHYLIFKSLLEGFYPNITIAARHVNDYMTKYIADKTISLMLQSRINILEAQIAICGITFKENYNEVENSKVLDLINELKALNANVIVSDPIADQNQLKENYGIDLIPFQNLKKIDAMIFAVAHHQYRQLNSEEIFKRLNKPAVIIDVKCIFNENDLAANKQITYWQL